MAFRKTTTLQLNTDFAQFTRQANTEKVAKLSDFDFKPEPGFLYVTTRAISSRVNANNDGWPPEELRNGYRTFIGKPVFVDHNNWDLNRARGVVLDASIHESKLAANYDETWVELLIEVDAVAFPKLAQAIVEGKIDAVSMGADVDFTVCSVCDNVAHEPRQFCAHIPQMKGKLVETPDKVAGKKMKKLCYEDCFGVKFFELSFVFEPADESAIISDTYLAPKAANRTLGHVRKEYENLEDYSQRVGMVKTADVAQIALPQPVNTLRDELDCPQCGAEWDGVICQSCGFELPPEGLGDPTAGVAFQQGLLMKQLQQMLQSGMDMNSAIQKMEQGGVSPQLLEVLIQMIGQQEQQQQQQQQQQPQQQAPSAGAQDSSKKEEKPKKKKKNTKKKTSGYEGGSSVSRYDSFTKEATLPQDPQYVQDTSGNPGTQVGPYGTTEPSVPQGFEQALEPAAAAPAQLQDLDAPDVQGPIGQSTVNVVAEQPGPTGDLPPGTAVGEQINVHAASAEEEVAEVNEEALRQSEIEKTADVVTQTDVRALDEPPAVDLGADATVNVLSPVLQPDQLALADTTDVINDGAETGLPAGPDFRARLQQQVNPFNEAALYPYQPVNPQVTASVESEEALEARIQQRVDSEKTRVLRIANFVDERIDMGLTEPGQKFEEIARFEGMENDTLDGYIQATREVKASDLRQASKRVRVAAVQEDNATVRMPSLGYAPKTASIAEEIDEADDYIAFL